MKEREPKQNWAEEEAKLWCKANKVMANLVGSFGTSVFIEVSISGRNGQPSHPYLAQPLDTGCPRKGDEG